MKPVVFEGNVLAIVKNYNEDKSLHEGTYWDGDDCKPVKSAAKEFYIAEQRRKCCYCKTLINSSNQIMWSLDHVIPKKNFPQFMFEPKNLAAACPDCNIAKADKVLLDRSDRKRFPTNSKAYKIVHPHFDVWEKHIQKIGRYIYYGNDKKGSATIWECGIFRYAQERIPGGAIADDRFEALADDLFFGRRSQKLAALDAFRAIIEAQEDDEDD